jgi:hypothetical protein
MEDEPIAVDVAFYMDFDLMDPKFYKDEDDEE